MVSRLTKFAWWTKSNFFRWILPVFIAGLSVLGSLAYLQRPQTDSPFLASHILIFGIVNFNLIILFVLVFLVGRNIIKLVFDRRRNILGSRLRARLVLVFVALAMVPSIIVCVLATGLLTQAMQGWFSGHVEGAARGAISIAQSYYGEQKKRAKKSASELSVFIKKNPLQAQADVRHSTLERKRKQYGLFALALLDANGELKGDATHATASIDGFKLPVVNQPAMSRALDGEIVVLFEEQGQGLFVRSYAVTLLDEKPHVVLATSRIDPKLSESLHVVNESYREYAQLKLFRMPLQTSYVLTLVMITGLILFAAIWIGFFIAREITGPIQRLAEATNEVAKGNYDIQVAAKGDDEITFLIKSFNTMISDLKESTRKSEERRVYLETILANLAVGVIGVSASGRVTAINYAAEEILGLELDQIESARTLDGLLDPALMDQIAGLLQKTFAEDEGIRDERAEQEVRLEVQGIQKRIVCTAGRLESDSGEFQGGVLLFDDVTALSRAQQQAAWREAARRIAHEIKNPLTPLKLSAQRLQRLAEVGSVDPRAKESASVIVEHVDSIKRLTDEFSKFARMPEVSFASCQINEMIQGVLQGFADSYPSVVFQFIPGNDIPVCVLDKEHIRRCLFNIIENAASAVSDEPTPSEPPRVTIRTGWSKKRDVVSVEVLDNGPGIPAAIRDKVFEPYFTTKDKGSGLGLAIVNSVVADHQGNIQVKGRSGGGTHVIIELPLNPEEATRRKFVNL